MARLEDITVGRIVVGLECSLKICTDTKLCITFSLNDLK